MKNNLNLKSKFIICTIIPIIILSSMMILPIITIFKGEVIYLESNVYRNSEAFRGENLTIQYKISQIDETKIPDSIKSLKSNNFRNNIKAYVVLKQEGNVYDIDYVTLSKPTDNKYLKCNLSIYDEITPDNKSKLMCYANYNLDKFYNAKELNIESDYNFENNMDKIENIKWNYVAKIKIYNGYSILEDILNAD